MDIEIIEKNWNNYSQILARLQDENIDRMIETLGDRLCIAPANGRNTDYGCYGGGLVHTSIMLARSMQALNEFHQSPCDVKSIYKIGFLHDIGRLGTLTQDWLITQDSDWHREKLGLEFKKNDQLPEMTQLQRTMYLLNHFQVQLTEEEYMALISLEDRIAKNTLGALLLHARNMLDD